MKAIGMKLLRTSAAALVLVNLIVMPAEAAYTVTFAQVGANVVANGSGTLNLGDLTLVHTGPNDGGQVSPGMSSVDTGPVVIGSVVFDIWEVSDSHLTASPITFGLGPTTIADAGTGDLVGVSRETGGFYLDVPSGYVSGTALISSSTWNNRTIASLGLIPGTYTWTWGSGVTADSFTLIIQGTAAAGPVASASPASLTFGNQTVNTTSATQTITVTNTGTADLLVTSVTATGANAGDFNFTLNSPCVSPVAPSATCTVMVSFTPSAAGSRTATLQIASNDPASPLAIALSGTGTGAGAVAPAITSGTPPGGTVGTPYSFTVVATGTAPITFSSNDLPAGLGIDPVSGVISGTPTTPTIGSTPVMVTASNGTLPNANQYFSMRISPAAVTPSGVTSVPTLSEWGLMLMSLLLAGFTALRLGRSADSSRKE